MKLNDESSVSTFSTFMAPKVIPLLLASMTCGLASQPWTLTLVEDATGMARCLDGSPPGFYIRPGFGSGSKKWVIHLQGGGWCASPSDCLQRANGYNPWGEPSIGGSGTWPRSGTCPDSKLPACISDGGDHGMLSGNASINPSWWNANAVWMGYWYVGNTTVYHT